MSEWKRTQLYETHVAAGATMVEFGGWDMPVQYPTGIVAEHLFTRHACSLFDVSHMGRILVSGPQRVEFLQHVLTSNVRALDLNRAQYCMLSDENGFAIDDAYLYRFEEDRFLLVVNAANTDKDWAHLSEQVKGYDCRLQNITAEWAAIAVQGPQSKAILSGLAGGADVTEPMRNALNTLELEGRLVRVSKTGYTGEPLGYEVYVKSEDAVWLWNRLIECGARPAGLGARDTLRLEAGLPLYGHELGLDPEGKPIPIFAVPLARFAVSFSPLKGDFIGRAALQAQSDAYKRIMNRDNSDIAALPRRVRPIALLDRGVIRAGMPVYYKGEQVGWVTSGTMVPYYANENEIWMEEADGAEVFKRSIGSCYISSGILDDAEVEVDVRGRRLRAVIPERHLDNMAPPYARPIVYGTVVKDPEVVYEAAPPLNLLLRAESNHIWRQKRCVNLIPSENTPSRAVQLLCASDPSCRYAEHKKVKSFYNKDIFYYQGTDFIFEVERLLVDEMRKYFGCTEVETRVVSGQMANTAVFSALMDWKNRLDRRRTPERLGYVMNNHIIRGGHLSAQPMGALHDYIAVDPVTERSAIVNFPVCKYNIFKTDVEETKKLLDQHRPEFIIFGKSMILQKEPVAEIRRFVDEQKIPTTIMYDMAHVLGLVGDWFQKPFEEGAEIVTGSTHKTFFGPQRGVVAVNYREDELKYGLWQSIQNRAFPGSVSNHHLGTQLGLLMAAYEMNAFKDEYQKAVIMNAKHFARALKAQGLDVCGDPAVDYTETHQVLLRVGYGNGAEIARRLENNNVIVNYQALPDEEGFTASGALRMGVSEMTRFGFGPKEFEQLAALMADCIRNKTPIGEEVSRLRRGFTEMRYCFSDESFNEALDSFAGMIGF